MISLFKSQWYNVCVVALFCWVAVAGTVLAWRTGLTTDEGIHTASAYLALTRGDTRFDTEHPFLFKYLTAIPILALQPNLPPNDKALWERGRPTMYDSWRESREWADEWFYTSGNNAKLMIFLARIPGVLALFLLCWLVFHLGKKWFSNEVALWALFFTAFNPTLLAHGALTNTDIPFAATFILVLWALSEWREKTTLKSATWFGLSLGVSILTKFSGVVLLPIAFVWVLVVAIQQKIGWKKVVGHCALAIVVIWLAIWCVYFWRSPVRWDEQVFNTNIYPESYLSYHGKDFLPKLEVLRWILPTDFLKGLLLTTGQTQAGRETFLLGNVFLRGKWFYFPIIFLLKNQIIVLLLFFASLWKNRKSWRPKSWSPLASLMLIAVIIFGGLAVKSRLDLGVRHIAPLLVLMSFTLGLVIVNTNSFLRLSWVRACVIGLTVLPVLWQSGNLIGFANIAVFPHDKAHWYFDDSNLDWGQEAEGVAELDKTILNHAPIYIYFRWNPYALTYFGANAKPLDAVHWPTDGYLGVCAFVLNRDPRYRKLWDVKPDFNIQNGVFLYRWNRVPR